MVTFVATTPQFTCLCLVPILDPILVIGEYSFTPKFANFCNLYCNHMVERLGR